MGAENHLFNILLGLFVLALATGLLLTPLARRFALWSGLQDQPGTRKIHAKVIPYGGGIAIFCVTIGLLLLTYFGGLYLGRAQWTPSSYWHERVKDYLGGLALAKTRWRLGALVFGGTMVFALGLIDDYRGVSPRVKLLVQGAAAGLLVWSGTTATVFMQAPWIGGAITIIWIVAVTNAFNLLDNMDGLSAGVAAVSGALLLVVALQGEQIFLAAFLVIFIGALLGFLPYNFPPARLFMGDAGSLFIGYILAALTVTGTYYNGRANENLYAVCTPILILGVPLFDTASVICIRLANGKSIFQGDTNHFSHRLVRLGMTRREAVLTIYLLALLLGAAATLLRQLDAAGAVTIFLIGLGLIVLIVLLENAALRRAEPPDESLSTAVTVNPKPSADNAPPAESSDV